METFKVIDKENKHYKISVEQDEHCDSPDDWRNSDMFLIFEHRSFTIKRKNFDAKEVFEEFKLRDKEQRESEFKDYFIFPVSAYIHSGVSLSLGVNTSGFDNSFAGFILVHKTDLDYPMQRNSVAELKDKTSIEIAEHYAEGLIDVWNIYLRGEVYILNSYELNKCECCGNEESGKMLECYGGTYLGEDESIEDLVKNFCQEQSIEIKIIKEL